MTGAPTAHPPMRRRGPASWRDGVAIAGAAAMLAYAAWRLPPASALRTLPQTPIDNSQNHSAAAWYRLLLEAARHIPSGANVLVRGATPQGDQDTYIQRFGVALLPGRKVLPPIPNIEAMADYFVIVGAGEPIAGASVLAATPDGSIWKRRP